MDTYKTDTIDKPVNQLRIQESSAIGYFYVVLQEGQDNLTP